MSILDFILVLLKASSKADVLLYQLPVDVYEYRLTYDKS